MKLEPKFDIGQTVFVASSTYKQTDIQCPDCLGTRIWQVLTPRGETWEIECGNCKSGWFSTGFISEYHYSPTVKRMTVGSLRIDTDDKEHPICYMMEETGVGSGQIHYEENIFATYEEALARAQIINQQQTEERNLTLEKQKQTTRKNASRKLSYEDKKIQTLEKEIKKLTKTIKKTELSVNNEAHNDQNC